MLSLLTTAQATTKKPYSMDENLFHISYESGVLEDPWVAPPADIFRITADPATAPEVGRCGVVCVVVAALTRVLLAARRGDPHRL